MKLLLVHTAVMPLTLLQLAFAEIETPAAEDGIGDVSVERQNALCKSMAGRIKSRCLGLLEVTDITCTDEKYRRVQFLHKTVKDFIATPKMMRRIQGCLSKNEPFMPEIAIIQALSIELRRVKSRLREGQFCNGDGLTREAWFDDVRPIVLEAVCYTAIAESKNPKSRPIYSPLIIEINEMTTNLWESVNFRAPEEITKSIHWSDAPRKPGATIMTKDLVSLSLPNAIQNSEQNDDAAGDETLVADTTGPSVPAEKNSVVTISLQPGNPMRVRFAGLPTPQCFPGEDDDDERPTRQWPTKSIWDSPFRLAGVNSMTNSEFKNFVRSLGLKEYAHERFGNITDTRTTDQTLKTGIAPDGDSLGNRTRVQKTNKSLWSILKSLWSRKRRRREQDR